MDDKKALLCVAVGVEEMAEALRLVEQESKHADVIEVRLDNLTDLTQIDYPAFLEAASVPLLFTLRPDWEGGQYKGSESDRIGLLARACEAGAAYIDCELRAPSGSQRYLREKCRETGARLILSYHDFSSTPSVNTLVDVLNQMSENRADIGKIVTTADNALEVLNVLGLQIPAREMGLPLIAFCMGKAGVISRVATVELGGFMTYCTAGSDIQTAPGQLTVGQLRNVLDQLG